MIQIKRGATTVATVNPLSSSNMSKAVMGEEQITLVWEAPAFVSYSVNDYITVEGSNWTLNRLPTVKKLSSKLWQYNAVFQSTKYDLIKAMYLLFDNTETLPAGEFSLTGTADTFMELLVSNLNRVAGSTLWSVGDVIENTDYKNLTFSNEDCLSVLARLADEFDTEYHVANHTIHLKRISTERNITLQYGSTLYDIERASVDSGDVVTRLYPFGSTRNLASNYRGGNSPLRIPVANGNYIENNVGLYGVIERAMTFEDIYPRLSSGGAGVVTGVGNEFTFTDSALDFNVNDQLLDGTPAKVHFNTGECAGYDFEIASYNHTTKTFVLIANKQENDFTLPTATLKPAVSDKYVLLDIVMPPAYLTAAEAELLTKAQEYIGQNSTPKVSYKTTFSAIYARQNLQNVECGDTVTVYDADMGINEQIRIIKFQKGLTDYWTVQFDLANTVTATRLERIEGNVATVENTVVVANQRINRNNLLAYQNTKELQSMVFDPDGYFDAENIKPLSIETTMLSVGAKSQSFQLSSLLQPNYEGNPQVLAWGAGVLTHFTIVDDAIKEWVISEGSITITGGNQTAALYIYARCSRAGTTGDIYLSATATKFDADDTYYFFLLGVLHTPINSVRGVSLTYGQTTINGQFIKTGVISSIDGATYFNLNTGEIGGNIKFRASDNSLKTVETAIDEIEVGGANLYDKTDIPVKLSEGGAIERLSDYEWFLTGTQGALTVFRIPNVITENGWWTVSFDLRGSQGVGVGIDVDICDNNSIGGGVLTTADNQYRRVSFTANVQNQTDVLYNFIDINCGNWAWYYIRNIQIEKGNKATDYTISDNDLKADATAKANAAQAAAEAYALAKAELAETTAKAHADGIVDAEEARAIADATAKANAAKELAISTAAADATAKAGTAQTNAINASLEYGTGKNLFPQAEFANGLEDWFVRHTVGSYPALVGVNSQYWPALGDNINLRNNQGLNTVYMWHDQTTYYESPYTYAYCPKIQIQGGKKYIASIYAANHRAISVQMYVEFYNSAGEWLAWSGVSENNQLLDTELKLGGADINGYKRLFSVVTAPQTATQMQLTILKYPTKVGSPATQLTGSLSFAFFCRPMLEQVADQTTKPGVWTPYASGAEVAESKALLADIASDSKLAPNDKQTVLREWQAIQRDFNAVEIEAVVLGIDDTDYDSYADFVNWYSELSTYITPLLASMSTTSDIVAATFNQKFENCRDGIAGQRYANSMAVKATADAQAYLKAAIAQVTEINGGLVLAAALCARDLNGNVTSYLNGLTQKPYAVAAGVQNWGTGTESARSWVDFLGNAKFGNLRIGTNGDGTTWIEDVNGVTRFEFSVKNIPALATLLAAAGQDETINNAYADFTTSGSYVLPNSVDVDNHNSELTVSGTIEAFADIDTPNDQASMNIQVYLIKSDNSVYAGIQSAMAIVESGFSDSISQPFSVKLVGVPAGNYRIKVTRAAFTTGTGTVSANISATTMRAFFAADNRAMIFGSDGLSLFWDIQKYFHIKSGAITYRGAWDVPAGLGGASINSSGTVISWWGKITGSDKVSKSGSNYTITHDIGNTDYSIILTPKSTNVPYFLDANRGSSTIVVTCAGGFDFILVRTK